MGMNHFGEISNLSKITKPTISVITNVGTSHIGNLGSRENILKAKLEILDGMTKPALVINNDNDLLHKWAEENPGKIPINTYGIANKSEVYADNIKLNENSSTCKFHYENEEIDIQIPIGGEHFVYNAMCAFLVGKLLGLSKEEIKAGIESFELTKKRMEVTKLKNNITVINDSYNASYESMKAALSYLVSMNTGRKIAVLGDMFELGDFAKELHEKVGIEVANNKIDILLCCGENSKYIAEQAILGGLESSNVFYLDNIEQIEEKLTEILKENDNVLIKASHGMNFMKLADNLINSKVTR
jgi:UDP-N-acetylmuramoyl-tripeptide--D-alanyl-D-alanine ligase